MKPDDQCAWCGHFRLHHGSCSCDVITRQDLVMFGLFGSYKHQCPCPKFQEGVEA